MNPTTTAYPLSWPDTAGPRTAKRVRAAFSRDRRPLGMTDALYRLVGELHRLKAAKWIISTNVEVRGDGLPYANRRAPEDPGAALYFTLKGKPMAMACDHWTRVEDNIAALAAHIECLRGIERYGVGTVEQAFRGYMALPAPMTLGRPWQEILNLTGRVSLAEAEDRYRKLATAMHPDRPGGSHAAMAALNNAIKQAREALGAKP